jgi:hypothetical protein
MAMAMAASLADFIGKFCGARRGGASPGRRRRTGGRKCPAAALDKHRLRLSLGA